MNDNPDYFRPLSPKGTRRAKWHDYRSRCIYMLTLNKAQGIPDFSEIRGRLDSYEWRPRVYHSPLGELIGQQMSAIKAAYPNTQILRRVIMPDHIHFVLFNTVAGDYHLGDVIRHLKSACAHAYYNIPPHHPVNQPSLFEDDYHDRILIKRNQLDNMLNYVSSNPRRRLERQTYRTFHRRFIIKDADGNMYEGYGNVHLLDDYDIEPVKISRSYSADELRNKKICWLRTVENGGVLVSPFISQAERKVRDWAIDNGGRLIIILNNGYGPRYTPKGRLHDLCNQGRLLLIAPIEYQTAKVACTYVGCQAMNQLAIRIAAGEYRPG